MDNDNKERACKEFITPCFWSVFSKVSNLTSNVPVIQVKAIYNLALMSLNHRRYDIAPTAENIWILYWK